MILMRDDASFHDESSSALNDAASSASIQSAGDDNDDDGDDDDYDDDTSVPRNIVLQRLLNFVHRLVIHPMFDADNDDEPDMIEINNKSFYHSTHCRHLTSLLIVASFCQELLLSHRTTTIREVYYFYVTHFFNQKECDKAIWDLCSQLKVSRSSLGLFASPKGWFCGCIDLYNEAGKLVLNGRELDNIHGMPITSTTHRHTIVSQDAEFILVIEKEGVYTRLAEDQFFRKYHPCILVTGKGFPDVATRQWVRQMATSLNIPVYGLADCNPYGIAVLNSYQYKQVSAQRKNNKSTNTTTTTTTKTTRATTTTHSMQWIGLRPSQVDTLNLPDTVMQQMTDRDLSILNSFQQETHPFGQQGNNLKLRRYELALFRKNKKKVELEALNWKGMDFLCQWVHELIMAHQQQVRLIIKQGKDNESHGCADDDDDEENMVELTNII
jgi:meiotic recombination protein SPO11